MANCTSTVSGYFSLGLNGVFHVLILFIFLTVLFFALIAPLSRGAFEHEIENEIGNSFKAVAKKISPQDRAQLSQLINSELGEGKTVIGMAIDHYSVPTDVLVENNKWVRRSAIEIIFGLTVCILVVVLVVAYSCNKCTGVFGILKENLITFAFIGVVEYLFFTRIAFKFIPAPPSTMVTALTKTFQKNFV